MSVLPIVDIGTPILREQARLVEREELMSSACQDFIDDLIETMRAANGAGIAANQVGDERRICVIEIRPGNPRYPYKPTHPLTVLVNPAFVAVSDATYANNEGCLSVPNLRGDLERPRAVTIEAWDRGGEPIRVELRGLTAGTAQHELDHLDGKLFVDRVADPRTLSTWDTFAEYRQEDFVQHIRTVVKETT